MARTSTSHKKEIAEIKEISNETNKKLNSFPFSFWGGLIIGFIAGFLSNIVYNWIF
ncbi:hypothetical protein M0Q39_04945 [Patescibacteria group bacterium]|nr:hypothetical protein [Patescibacteria group bacterium]MDD3940095.1 hypothetical protein [Candidatus Paceibacterota bacterium]